MTKKKRDIYSWRITLSKFCIILVEVLIAGCISYITENSSFLLLIPILEAFRNYIKHK